MTVKFIASIAIILSVVLVVATEVDSISAECRYKFGRIAECAPIQEFKIDSIKHKWEMQEVVENNQRVRRCVSVTEWKGDFSVIEGLAASMGVGIDIHTPSRYSHHYFDSRDNRWVNGGSTRHNPSPYDPGFFIATRMSDGGYWRWQKSLTTDWARMQVPISTPTQDQVLLKSPIDLILHDRTRGYAYIPSSDVPIDDSLLKSARDAAYIQCQHILAAASDRAVQDFTHRQNIAVAEAKIEGAKVRRDFYLSLIPPLEAQIAELDAIMPKVLVALAEAEAAHAKLQERQLEYARLVEEFALAESEAYTRLMLAVESAQRAIGESVARTEAHRDDVKANIERINEMKAQIQADITRASQSVADAQADLDKLTSQ